LLLDLLRDHAGFCVMISTRGGEGRIGFDVDFNAPNVPAASEAASTISTMCGTKKDIDEPGHISLPPVHGETRAFGYYPISIPNPGDDLNLFPVLLRF